MLFLRAIKNISGNPDSSNKTRMTTRSLGYNALFHLKTNATLLDLRRICEDFAPVKYSSMLLYPDVFSLPPRILHPRRTSSRTRSPFLRLLSFSLPNLPFEQQLIVGAKFRSVDVANKIAQTGEITSCMVWYSFITPTSFATCPSHESRITAARWHFRIRFRDQMEHARDFIISRFLSRRLFPRACQSGANWVLRRGRIPERRATRERRQEIEERMRLRGGWSDRLADLSDYNLVGRVEDGGPPFAVARRGRDAAIIQFHGGCNFFFYRANWIYLIIMTYYSCLVNPGNVY